MFANGVSCRRSLDNGKDVESLLQTAYQLQSDDEDLEAVKMYRDTFGPLLFSFGPLELYCSSPNQSLHMLDKLARASNFISQLCAFTKLTVGSCIMLSVYGVDKQGISVDSKLQQVQKSLTATSKGTAVYVGLSFSSESDEFLQEKLNCLYGFVQPN